MIDSIHALMPCLIFIGLAIMVATWRTVPPERPIVKWDVNLAVIDSARRAPCRIVVVAEARSHLDASRIAKKKAAARGFHILYEHGVNVHGKRRRA
jgi:hypothetical protein